MLLRPAERFRQRSVYIEHLQAVTCRYLQVTWTKKLVFILLRVDTAKLDFPSGSRLTSNFSRKRIGKSKSCFNLVGITPTKRTGPFLGTESQTIPWSKLRGLLPILARALMN